MKRAIENAMPLLVILAVVGCSVLLYQYWVWRSSNPSGDLDDVTSIVIHGEWIPEPEQGPYKSTERDEIGIVYNLLFREPRIEEIPTSINPAIEIFIKYDNGRVDIVRSNGLGVMMVSFNESSYPLYFELTPSDHQKLLDEIQQWGRS